MNTKRCNFPGSPVSKSKSGEYTFDLSDPHSGQEFRSPFGSSCPLAWCPGRRWCLSGLLVHRCQATEKLKQRALRCTQRTADPDRFELSTFYALQRPTPERRETQPLAATASGHFSETGNVRQRNQRLVETDCHSITQKKPGRRSRSRRCRLVGYCVQVHRPAGEFTLCEMRLSGGTPQRLRAAAKLHPG
jgi:hypothetical protein